MDVDYQDSVALEPNKDSYGKSIIEDGERPEHPHAKGKAPNKISCYNKPRSGRSVIRRSQSRPRKLLGKGQKGHERKRARTAVLSESMISCDPINVFADNCERTLADWIQLLGNTTAPANITSSDPSFISAFKFVDRILCGAQTSHLLRRLAFVQLMRLSDSLGAIVRSERERGLRRTSGVVDASVVIDIYKSAQEGRLSTEELKWVVWERRRIGRRWTVLAGPSPLFLLVYSDVAEKVVLVLPYFMCKLKAYPLAQSQVLRNKHDDFETAGCQRPAECSCRAG